MTLHEPLQNDNRAHNAASEISGAAYVQAITLSADAASPPISHGSEWEAGSTRIKAGC